jgi:hypothetical protein
MSDLRTELREAMRTMKKPAQPYVPKQHTITRANLSDQEPGVLPALSDMFFKTADPKNKNPGKFYKQLQDVPFTNKQSFNNAKRPAYPKPFADFTRKFLSIPCNCAFYKKGDRTYMCRSDQDRWERCESNHDFWETVKDYLWGSYLRFLSKARNQVPTNKYFWREVDEAHDIKHEEVPVNKAGLIAIIMKNRPDDGSKRLIELLEDAYRSRNKNH